MQKGYEGRQSGFAEAYFYKANALNITISIVMNNKIIDEINIRTAQFKKSIICKQVSRHSGGQIEIFCKKLTF